MANKGAPPESSPGALSLLEGGVDGGTPMAELVRVGSEKTAVIRD